MALGARLAYAAPLAAGLGTLAMLAGLFEQGAALWIAAPLALFGASVAIVLRQRELHTVRLAGFARYAAVALLAGYVWLAVSGIAWAFAPRLRDLALLHLSLLLRVGFGPEDFMARAWGGALNAAALVLFIATLAYSIATRERG